MEILKKETFNVKINGNDTELASVSTVGQMLIARSIIGTMFVVEKNGEIVPKENYSQTVIKNGDSFEIVCVFGGG